MYIHAKQNNQKTLENTSFSSIFKGFCFGAEGGIRTLKKCRKINWFVDFD